MNHIKVLAITGIRSEYDILYPVIKILKDCEKFDVKVVVSGAHLSDFHGYTISKIEEDGFQIVEKIDSLFMTNRKTQRVKGVGILTYALSQTVERERPDFLLVVGDREESIATALVGNYMDVLTAHIGGGDPVFGNADDPIRFAVSKLSHIHFTTANEYAENLRKLGEEDFRIFFVGNPAYYNIENTQHISLEHLSKILNFNITNGRYIVFIKHPLSSEQEEAYRQIKISLEALKIFVEKYNYKVIGIYPNTDPGSYNILKAIQEISHPNIKFFKTLPREIFVNLMRGARCLVGNSSMGILEAPFYKLPVVNIGNRQRGRLNAGNVEFVDYNIENIITSITKAVFDEEYRERVKNLRNPFGDATAPYKIRDILLSIDLKDKKWYIKRKLI
ncbi:MAG: UDP-N,N'-diacetylbacillosamine 2-epimerase (hydrolyzing) [Candidatus Woesearchaeota archaeon]|nr:MAG: UDP-N,N'-diacetylbacillosamine 2-epimerase (hydrolyzing) [Candidatus Woesearchaeota archaeon]